MHKNELFNFVISANKKQELQKGFYKVFPDQMNELSSYKNTKNFKGEHKTGKSFFRKKKTKKPKK